MQPIRKTPDPVDVHVGGRIRMRRIMKDISQQELGGYIGVTFQQVQKYEKGVNRVGASRMQQISRVLDVPVAFFFEGADGSKPSSGGLPQYLVTFMGTTDGQRIVEALGRIRDNEVRHCVARLVTAIADMVPKKPPGKQKVK